MKIFSNGLWLMKLLACWSSGSHLFSARWWVRWPRERSSCRTVSQRAPACTGGGISPVREQIQIDLWTNHSITLVHSHQLNQIKYNNRYTIRILTIQNNCNSNPHHWRCKQHSRPSASAEGRSCRRWLCLSPHHHCPSYTCQTHSKLAHFPIEMGNKQHYYNNMHTIL